MSEQPPKSRMEPKYRGNEFLHERNQPVPSPHMQQLMTGDGVLCIRIQRHERRREQYDGPNNTKSYRADTLIRDAKQRIGPGARARCADRFRWWIERLSGAFVPVDDE